LEGKSYSTIDTKGSGKLQLLGQENLLIYFSKRSGGMEGFYIQTIISLALFLGISCGTIG
jgi:hypothetical protein